MAVNIGGLYKSHFDGWRNFFSGLGGGQDKTQQTFFKDFPILIYEDLSRLWYGNGIGKKIVSAPADDMTKNWIKIAHDDDNILMKELMRLKSKSKFNLVTKWIRLYGGGVIVMGIRDSGRLTKPVRGWPNNISIAGIDWLEVYSSADVDNINQMDIVKKTRDPLFGDIEEFRIRTKAGNSFRVHRSRCLVFKGEPSPARIDSIGFDAIYWGVSALQSVYENIRTFGGVTQSIANILYEFIIGKYTIANLEELLADGKIEDIYTRLNIIERSKSMIQAVLLGPDEKYERDTANVAGLADLMDKFMIILSAVSEIPATRLWGQSPKGENATGESDLTNYYDFIESKQESQITEPTQTLVEYINSYKKAVTGDKIPVVSYNSPRSPKPKEAAEIKKLEAETENIWIQNAVKNPEDVAEEKFPEE